MTKPKPTPKEPCGVCGDTTGACRFERACSCWRGKPCGGKR